MRRKLELLGNVLIIAAGFAALAYVIIGNAIAHAG